MLKNRLEQLFAAAPEYRLKTYSRIVFLSDLHMGNGSRRDDFSKNAALLLKALESYYLPRGYTLILNGDIEELLRCRREDIQNSYVDLYRILDLFRGQKRLIWLQGNHEIVSGISERPYYMDGEAVRLRHASGTLFVFHGHQTGKLNSGKYNHLIGWFLRTFADRAGIGNFSIAHNSSKKFKLEKLVYDFSRNKQIVSIIGHTHRPLFESLSKNESLGYRIERLCRRYPGAGSDERKKIKMTIQKLKWQLLTRSRQRYLSDNIYGDILVPCLFNAGCGIGRRGVTALEIKKGRLYLVYWSDKNRTQKFREYNEIRSLRMIDDQVFRFILRRERLDYIFSRIELLSKEESGGLV